MRWRFWRVPLILAIACFALAWGIVQIKRQGVMLKGRYHLSTGEAVISGAWPGRISEVLLEELKGTSLVPPEIEDPNWLKVFAYHGIEHADADFTPTYRKYPPKGGILAASLEFNSFSIWAPLREHVKMTALLPQVEDQEWDVDCEGAYVLALCIKDRWFGLGEGVHWELNREGKLEPIYATGIFFGATHRWSPSIYADITAWMTPGPDYASIYGSYIVGSRTHATRHWGRTKLQCPAYVPLSLLLYSAVMLGYLLWRPLLRAFRFRRR